ncbi:MAG TPA: bifunctional 4-hydroxy-2-oxoglutarate aldolase/2-dehydro-3-deoxy-phosphogluconate aldolase [Solirubrobacteraceae bacterium]|nr:bifunctional 4-hydroxy-2-oxoglutarate aldolase/2-dehydro-3-deoxy-phosphogluconate aldolase [Solirubrobacteraceae bacterium]
MTETFERLRAARVIAVLRTPDADSGVRAARALAEGGVRAIELTFTTPGAEDAIRRARAELGDEVVVGAGTIRDRAQLDAALVAGADFLVTPHLDHELLDAMLATGRAVLPGTLTPSEVGAALAAGAEAVKLFPASVVGPSYVGALRGPFPEVQVVPTGGIGPGDVQPWLDAGALAVGAGGELCPAALVTEDRWDELSATAERFLAA